MDKRPITCCFTGHRRFRPGDAPRVQTRLEEIVEQLILYHGVCYFGAGGALGFDTMAADTVLRFRARYSQIRLILVLPCPEQADRWPAADAAVYEHQKQLADRTVYTAPHYFDGCMQKRTAIWCNARPGVSATSTPIPGERPIPWSMRENKI